jgi:hypothetical protein
LFGLDVASAFSYFDFVAQFYALLDSLLLVNAGCGVTVGVRKGYTDITQKSFFFITLLVQGGLSEGPFGILLRGYSRCNLSKTEPYMIYLCIYTGFHGWNLAVSL